MKSFIHRSFLTLFLLSFSYISQADVIADIGNALKSGDSSSLAAYFNSSIELVVIEKEGIYSKDQAEIIVSTFFNENKPSKYTALHQGGKPEATYVIGNLETSTGNFRVYYLVKDEGGSKLIYQLRFEKE